MALDASGGASDTSLAEPSGGLRDAIVDYPYNQQ
jgi:hypothetical protein